MKKGLFILLIFCFSLTVISCNRKTSTTSSSDRNLNHSTTDVSYSGVWIKDNSTSWFAIINYTFDEFSTTNINYSSYRIIDFEAVNVGNEIKYSAIFISDGTSDSHCFRCDYTTIQSHVETMRSYYVIPIDYEKHYENGNWYYSLIWADSRYGNGGSYGWAIKYGKDKNIFLNDVSAYSGLGYNLIDIEIHWFGEKYGGLFTTQDFNYLFFWEKDYTEIINNVNTYKSSGYIPTDIEIHEISGVKKYNVILTKTSGEWDYLLDGTLQEFDTKNILMKNSGYRPIDFEVHTSEERNIGRLGQNLSVKNINLEYINPKLKRRN